MSGEASERSARYLASSLRRSVDVLIVVVALLLVSPVLVLVGLAIRVFDGAPVLFRQERVGREGVTFLLFKFRTMRAAVDRNASLLDEGARVTTLGEILRRTSIDELPGLINILRGDMSIIGPRPLLPLHVPLYEHSHPERLLVRPGLTGLAQVMGRKQLTFRQRLDLDVEYVRTAGLRLDLTIVARTVLTVLGGFAKESEGRIEAVDDIGLAAAIREAASLRRREHGSFLQPHGAVGSEGTIRGGPGTLGSEDAHAVFGTARQAMIAIIGTAPRVHLPSYYCPDVVDALRATIRAEIVRYPDHPLARPSTVRVGPDDLVVVLPHFGRPTGVTVEGGRLLIDTTHSVGRLGDGITTDASGRPADLCVASLRKTLPLPDGALVHCPVGGPLPVLPPLQLAHASSARRVAAALEAKAASLRGDGQDKPAILAELTAAIAELEASTLPSAALPETVEHLRGLDLGARWKVREENLRAAVRRLEELRLLEPIGPLRVLEAPFVLVLLARTNAEREHLRVGLIARDVYPAVLWPHERLAPGEPEREFGECMLALHVDARYSVADLVRVADQVHAALGARGDGT
jgi:lipopolysaccharide/colanic/teichoic acid biosynthesis glycosyltransferase